MKFAPTPGLTGTVQITFPDESPTRSAPYRITGTADSHAGNTLSIGLDPPWRGQFERDREHFKWLFTTGASNKSASCYLTQAQVPFTSVG